LLFKLKAFEEFDASLNNYREYIERKNINLRIYDSTSYNYFISRIRQDSMMRSAMKTYGKQFNNCFRKFARYFNRVKKDSTCRRCPELEIMGRIANKASNRSGCKFI